MHVIRCLNGCTDIFYNCVIFVILKKQTTKNWPVFRIRKPKITGTQARHGNNFKGNPYKAFEEDKTRQWISLSLSLSRGSPNSSQRWRRLSNIWRSTLAAVSTALMRHWSKKPSTPSSAARDITSSYYRTSVSCVMPLCARTRWAKSTTRRPAWTENAETVALKPCAPSSNPSWTNTPTPWSRGRPGTLCSRRSATVALYTLFALVLVNVLAQQIHLWCFS